MLVPYCAIWFYIASFEIILHLIIWYCDLDSYCSIKSHIGVLQGSLYFPAPGPCLGPQFLFTSPGPQFVFTGPGSNLYLPTPGPSWSLPSLANNFNFYYQSGAWLCIYRPCLLNLYLYLRPWPTICIIGLGSEFAFTLLLQAVVVKILVLVISLE